MWVQSLGQEDPLEENMAINSTILTWEIPGTEGPDGLWSVGSPVGDQNSNASSTVKQRVHAGSLQSCPTLSCLYGL